jgi:uncharacterized protein DUF4430
MPASALRRRPGDGPSRLSAAIALAAVVAVGTLAGCGLGAGPAPRAVTLTVTGAFGARLVRYWSEPHVRGAETVMSLLTRNATVSTRYGGGFVQSIDGLSGGQENGQSVDWFYYVNGIEAPKGAAATDVHAGDHIWWDHHDWSQTDAVPAVVGSFPEPFLNGIEGKRLPVRVECAAVAPHACGVVTSRLRAAGVPAAIAAIGSGGAPDTLRVMVGPWTSIAADPGARGIEKGPRASGVYARFSHAGSTLTVLDHAGRSARTLLAGAGLIAATRSGEGAPVWLVSGTDLAGVDHAAQSLTEGALRDRFAVAVTSGGAALALPQAGA